MLEDDFTNPINSNDRQEPIKNKQIETTEMLEDDFTNPINSNDRQEPIETHQVEPTEMLEDDFTNPINSNDRQEPIETHQVEPTEMLEDDFTNPINSNDCQEPIETHQVEPTEMLEDDFTNPINSNDRQDPIETHQVEPREMLEDVKDAKKNDKIENIKRCDDTVGTDKTNEIFNILEIYQENSDEPSEVQRKKNDLKFVQLQKKIDFILKAFEDKVEPIVRNFCEKQPESNKEREEEFIRVSSSIKNKIFSLDGIIVFEDDINSPEMKALMDKRREAIINFLIYWKKLKKE